MKRITSSILLMLCFAFLGSLYSFANLETPQVKGWFLTGSKPELYEIGVIQDIERESKVAYIKSKKKSIKGFGTIMQVFSAKKYLGKKVKLTGFLKTEDVKGWVGMWMRVDGKEKNILSFDNMKDRKIEGSTYWKEYKIILEVPAESATINYGVLLHGEGIAFLDELSFEVVESENLSTGREYKNEPTNASFEE